MEKHEHGMASGMGMRMHTRMGYRLPMLSQILDAGDRACLIVILVGCWLLAFGSVG
jgi:hypothetical protein